MAEITVGGMTLHYEVSGLKGGPTVIFSGSLGQNVAQWDQQRTAFEAKFKVIRYDARGCGASRGVRGVGSVQAYGEDVLTILNAEKVEQAYYCGVSIGGMVGQWLAVHKSDRLKKFVLSNTSPRIGTENFWLDRAARVIESGVGQFVPGSKDRWLTVAFREQHPEDGEKLEAAVAACPRDGYASGCELLASTNLWAELPKISVPVLVIGGIYDPTTTPETMQEMAAKIPGAKYIELKAGHFAPWNQAEEWNKAAIEFLSE